MHKLRMDPILSKELFSRFGNVRKIDQQIHDKLPVLFNYQGQGGYFTMPSARMPKAGLTGFWLFLAPSLQCLESLFQFFDHVEAVGTYWVYRGITGGKFWPFGLWR